MNFELGSLPAQNKELSTELRDESEPFMPNAYMSNIPSKLLNAKELIF